MPAMPIAAGPAAEAGDGGFPDRKGDAATVDRVPFVATPTRASHGTGPARVASKLQQRPGVALRVRVATVAPIRLTWMKNRR